MPTVDIAELLGRLTRAGWPLQLTQADSPEFARLPEQWRPIALAPDPEVRGAAALALWNEEFLDLIPTFAELFRARLLDVRACALPSTSVLLYVVEGSGDVPFVWVGGDPRRFGTPPRFWDSLPEPARTFLREVHAGFTAPDQDSFGLMHPADMETIAAMAGYPDGLPGWTEADAAETKRIASNRLLRITKDSGNLLLCVSPDLPAGDAALVYEGDVDPQEFGPALDELMASAFDVG
jgi:hypothetical protein